MAEKSVMRKAQVSDVPQIVELVNHYAAQGLMLPRSYNRVYQNVRDFTVIEEEGTIVGCGALHVLWEDLAEIRSLAIVPELAGNGLGGQIVRRLIEEARELGIPTVFAFTYQVGFFERLGFQVVDKDTLPRKVWVECIDCIKYPNCDETAVVLHLNSNHKEQEK